jgi:hypothetical protein
LRPHKDPAGQGHTERLLTHGGVYHRVLRRHAKAAGIDRYRRRPIYYFSVIAFTADAVP